MATRTKKSRDPVCGIEVTISTGTPYSIGDRWGPYYFCSGNCLEKFRRNPDLYISVERLGQLQHRPITKRRRLKFVSVNAEALRSACGNLNRTVGVIRVEPENGCLVVEYDLQQVSLVEIEAVTAGSGLVFRNGLHAFQRNLWRFLEENEWDATQRCGTGACCNRPPPGVG